MPTNRYSFTQSVERSLTMSRWIHLVQRLIVSMFALFFFCFSIVFAVSALFAFISPILDNGDVVQGLVKGLNVAVVALAVYELAQIVYEEYDHGNQEDRILRMHRGITRFASVVFVALVLESLIMVIKYSQQDLAGFLYYPVAIISSAAFLLIALGVFTRLTGRAHPVPNPGRETV